MTDDPTRHVVSLSLYFPGLTVSPPYEKVAHYYTLSTVGVGELGVASSSSPTPAYNAAVPISSTTTAPGITHSLVHETETVKVSLGSSGVLPGGTLTIIISDYLSTRKLNADGVTYTYTNTTAYSRIDVDVAKLLCNDASIDSRKAFGQPNLEGELPGDPNAEARSVNFGPWFYKGGLFVGNMPFASGDQSGTARTQLYVASGGTGTLLGATLSMLDRGTPKQATGGCEIGVYVPAATDANLASAENTVTWSNRWNVLPRSTPSDPKDFSQDPISAFSFSTSTVNDYANWSLNGTFSVVPTMALSRLCLALTYEPDYINQGAAAWRYFGSKEHQALLASQFPDNDCQPRVWRVGRVSESAW
jgi:hypothetical protein